MSRIRVAFSKRDFFCFVRHVELPQLFGRIVRRAGLTMELTQGMSPHPRITLGPALPVGVVALRELAELWIVDPPSAENLLDRLNAAAPSGLQFLAAAELEGPSLNKAIDAGAYWFDLRDQSRRGLVESPLRQAIAPENLLYLQALEDGFELALGDPSSVGPGAVVKALSESGVIGGWPEICLARTTLGRWNPSSQQVDPLL